MISALAFMPVDLARAHVEGLHPAMVVAEALARRDAAHTLRDVLHRAEVQTRAKARAMDRPGGRPLWDMPSLVTDNIDEAEDDSAAKGLPCENADISGIGGITARGNRRAFPQQAEAAA